MGNIYRFEKQALMTENLLYQCGRLSVGFRPDDRKGASVADVYERGDRFARDIASMRISDPSPGRHDLWLRVGLGVMAAGLLLCAFAYYRSQAAADALVQRDAITLGLMGVAATIAGATVYMRYSITKVLRFWLARVSYDLQARPPAPPAPTPPPAKPIPAVRDGQQRRPSLGELR